MADSSLPPVPPPVPEAPQAKLEGAPMLKPWNFWFTLLFGAIIAVVWVMAQSIVVLAFIFLDADIDLTSMSDDDNKALMEIATDGDVLGWTTLIAGTVGILATIAFASIKGFPLSRYLALKAPHPLHLLLWTAILFAVSYTHTFLGSMLDRDEIPEFMLQTYQSTDYMILLWLGIAVMAPLSEEVFFRGFMYTGWRNAWLRPVGAAIVTAFLWAIIHGQYDWFDMSLIFVFGLILCGAREHSGSLWVPIFMHVANNAWATYATGVAIQESTAKL